MTALRAGQLTAEPGTWRKILFLAVACFYWITLTPFVDLSKNPALAKPSPWSLVITVVIFLALLAYTLRSPARQAIAQPRWLLVLIFGWLMITAGLGADGANAVRRVAIAMTVCISASAFLMLPVNERQFARLIGTVVMVVLTLNYLGVLLVPRLAIHQLNDFLQTNYAGKWHGLYVQKNEAGVVMVTSCFIALYLMTAWSRAVGLVIFAASAFFLIKTGAKTSMILLPGILMLSFVFERWRFSRPFIVFGGVGALNLATVGVVAFPPVKAFIASLGIDATYTARSDIWKLALSAISQRPLVGHGFQSFWQAKSLVNSDMRTYNWAVAAVDAHNAYLDAAVTAGVPGLILMIVWVLVTPLRDIAEIDRQKNFTPLSRLYLRIWLFGIFLAGLESVFLANSGTTWFILLVAMFGLSYQARYRLVQPGLVRDFHAPAFA